jgi:hypothetical protein
MELNEKLLKTILQEQRKEYQRYLGVASEDFKSQVQLIAESMQGMQQQLLAIRDIVAKNTEDIVKLQTHVSAIREMVAKNTEDIEVIRMDAHIIKDDLKEKVDRYELKALERRIEILEKKGK